MPGLDCRSSASPRTPSRQTFGSYLDNAMLSATKSSPALSSSSYPSLKLDRRSPCESSSCCDPKRALGCISTTSASSSGTSTAKSSGELMEEIAVLEAEIVQMESYLLSLYQTAFEEHIPTLLDNFKSCSQYKMASPFPLVSDQLCYREEPDKQGGNTAVQSWGYLKNQSYVASGAAMKMDPNSAYRENKSLVYRLTGECADNTLINPSRLSEDILRCISSIYCKLAHLSYANPSFSTSPTSSLSSLSVFSSQIPYNRGSPHCTKEVGMQKFQCLKNSEQHSTAIEVLKLCLDDDDSFSYAARMLQNFRSLVQHLEHVDPRKMKREEKLAFWINIQNAMVMHAFLAYGADKHLRRTSLLKAAYNVGGQNINAYDIRSSILGINTCKSMPWFQALLSPRKMYKTGNVKHDYFIEYPEPLVHFGLCSGAYSDPMVRVYNAASVFHDLRIAKEEFISATVHVHKNTKIFLPKVLCAFAEDKSLSILELLKEVKDCLPEVQQDGLRNCINGNPGKYIRWLQQNSTFRFVIDKKVIEGEYSSTWQLREEQL